MGNPCLERSILAGDTDEFHKDK